MTPQQLRLRTAEFAKDVDAFRGTAGRCGANERSGRTAARLQQLDGEQLSSCWPSPVARRVHGQDRGRVGGGRREPTLAATSRRVPARRCRPHRAATGRSDGTRRHLHELGEDRQTGRGRASPEKVGTTAAASATTSEDRARGDCRLPIQSIRDCRLPIADCRLPIADCRSIDYPITDFSAITRLPIPRLPMQARAARDVRTKKRGAPPEGSAPRVLTEPRSRTTPARRYERCAGS